MERKIDNNLIVVSYSNGDKLYFTSMSRAGVRMGITTASVKYAVEHGNKLIDSEDRVYTISIRECGEIPYKLINN